MKTEREWEILFRSHPLYRQWYENVRMQNGRFSREDYDMNVRQVTWHGFIDRSFNWSRTPQGMGFWDKFADNEPQFKNEIYYV